MTINIHIDNLYIDGKKQDVDVVEKIKEVLVESVNSVVFEDIKPKKSFKERLEEKMNEQVQI